MRHILPIVTVAFALMVWSGCSKSTPAPAEPAAKPAPPAAAADKAPTAAAPAASADKPSAGDKVPAKADESNLAPAPERKPELTKEECDKACAHATKLSMDSMPPDTTPKMQAAIRKALEESCPKDCVASGTKARLACILKAKTAMEMAAECQK